jgi:hypothetical protein
MITILGNFYLFREKIGDFLKIKAMIILSEYVNGKI